GLGVPTWFPSRCGQSRQGSSGGLLDLRAGDLQGGGVSGRNVGEAPVLARPISAPSQGGLAPVHVVTGDLVAVDTSLELVARLHRVREGQEKRQLPGLV